MKFEYGCIGEVLKHSFSKEIHNLLSDYDYRLIEISRDELPSFAKKKDFKAINVTIPYKEMIMPYMNEIDTGALNIGAVNTVVNKDGRLYGYNTDFFGMKSLILRNGISLQGKKAAVLGTGGTSKTAFAVLRSLGAGEIIKVSRSGKDGAITYSELYESHSDVQIIINTTPSGMFPNIFDSPIDLSKLSNPLLIIDAVYNPIRTPLVLSAKKRGINAEGGLYMLVSQAVKASEIFLDTQYPEGECERIFSKILSSKENIVLTGMPASGKSTVGKILSDMTSREFIDVDLKIEEDAGMPIPEIFKNYGEEHFRNIESEVIRRLSSLSGKIIATGGGAILREENTDALSLNGRIYFIDRPLSLLMPTDDRPLSRTKEDIKKRYEERYELYLKRCDKRIIADVDAYGVAEMILEDFKG